MKTTTKRLVTILILVALLLSVPTLALAERGGQKQVYKARLTTDQETTTVVDSNARGKFMLKTTPDGDFVFALKVRKLSGLVGGAHIHGPAGAGEDAGVVFTLCGEPQPGATAACPFENGMLVLRGTLDPGLLNGITPEQFMEYLDSGMLYVNVHTELNPAGEARGQIYPK